MIVTYLDASAILRIITPHEWSRPLVEFLTDRGHLATSMIGVIETHRSLMREAPTADELAEADQLLATFRKIAVSNEIVRSAIAIPSRTLRSMDAVHVASAIEIGASVLVSYDRNMIKAAREVGLRTASPGLN